MPAQGHPSPVLLRVGEATSLPFLSTGMMAGVMENIDIPVQSLELHAGDTFLFYTDGVTEAFDANGQQFGEPRLLAQFGGMGRTKLGRDGSQYSWSGAESCGGVSPIRRHCHRRCTLPGLMVERSCEASVAYLEGKDRFPRTIATTRDSTSKGVFLACLCYRWLAKQPRCVHLETHLHMQGGDHGRLDERHKGIERIDKVILSVATRQQGQ